MLIEDLKFRVLVELFSDHIDMIDAMSFDNGSISVKLNTKDYVWRTKRNSRGIELYYYEVSETEFLQKLNRLGYIDHADFRVLIID